MVLCIIVLIVATLYSHTFASRPDVRRSPEYKKAVKGFPDGWPVTGMIAVPASGIVLARLAWYIVASAHTPKRGLQFVTAQLLSYAALAVFLYGFVANW